MTAQPRIAIDEVRECLDRSVRLLRQNLTPRGILAASRSPEAEARRYTRIFGRDSAICALGMLYAGDSDLVDGARAGLLTLMEHQAANGQIPKYVDPDNDDSDFWYLGCIDATLWWLIAIRLLSRQVPEASIERQAGDAIAKAITWLQCQEHPRLHLLQQNEASDWADIMPRSGFVLYSNALWYYVKRLYGLPGVSETKSHFNQLFYPYSTHVPDYRRLRLLRHYVRNKTGNRDVYLSFVNFSFWGEEGDVFGNILAMLLGLAEGARCGRIIRALVEARVSSPYPVRAVLSPIRVSDPLWRSYMGRHRQNLVYQYHNGGCWPMIGAFWAMALSAIGQRQQAETELANLARANRVGDWAFYEWFHGQTGVPGGMRGQSWNAAAFILAYSALSGRIF